jgi:hypothetical protein
MTTFQALMSALSQVLVLATPIPPSLSNTIFGSILGFGEIPAPIHFWVTSIGACAFLYYFRFDYLGMISALIRSLFNPLTLKTENRSLDQHTLLFLTFTLLGRFLAQIILAPQFEDSFWIHPYAEAALCFSLAGAYQFSLRWNKRIYGLNHLKLSHLVITFPMAAISLHPAIPFLGAIWIALAVQNYHFEAIIKYSLMLLGVILTVSAVDLYSSVGGLKSALEHVGALNSIAVIVVSFTGFFLILEHFRKNFSESNYRTALWVSIISGIVIASHGYWTQMS